MTGQYSLNFLHRFNLLATQEQSLVLPLNWKELSSSQPPGDGVGAGTGGDGDEGVQKDILSFFPKSDF